ncbi:MAG: hypothetical protein J6N47_05650 [Lachnospiraceae bacterium]|nr:hypothetical protein [Lachnospiraceae bacterium]
MAENKKIPIEQLKKYVKPVAAIVIMALAFEIFVFNFRSVQSLFYKETNVPVDGNKMTGMKYFGDGVFKLTQDDVVGITVLEDGQSQSELEYGTGQGIGAEGNVVSALYLSNLEEITGTGGVHSIKLNVETPNSIDLPFTESGVLYVKTHIKDTGNAFLETLDDHPILQNNESSKYIYMQPSGRVSDIVLEFSMSNGQILTIKSITINARRPFMFSFYRFLIMLFIGIAAYSLRPASLLWQLDTLAKASWKKYVVLGLCIVFVTPAWLLIRDNVYLTNFVEFNPYQDLAVALSEGHCYINEEPDPALVALSNPYDDTLRSAMGIETKWDYALYNGKYYVYFGIVPCLLFYLPFYALLGIKMPNSLPILGAAVLLLVGIYMLIKAMAAVYYQKLKYAAHLILTAVIYFGCQMPFFLNQPDGYAVPVTCAEAMLVWGLYFWISSLKAEGWKMYVRVALGSFIMALIAGTRPNMEIYALLSVPVFVWFVKANLKAEKKSNVMGFAVAFVLPFIPVAAGLMCYNAVRFESVFEFGNNYNLTVSDMSLNPFSLDKLFIGVYEYLLKLPDLTYKFPFLSIPGDGTQSNAFAHCFVHMEYIFAGLLPVNILLWIIPILFKRTSEKKDVTSVAEKGKELESLRYFGLTAVVLALFLVLFDSESAGIVYRYEADFSIALYIGASAALMILMSKTEKYGEEARKICEKLLVLLLIVALVWSLIFHLNFYFLTGLKYPLLWGNTDLYYRIFYAFNFL